MKSQTGRYVVLASFVFGFGAFWNLVLPRGATGPSVQENQRSTDAHGIHTSDSRYANRGTMDPILDRWESVKPSSFALVEPPAITLISTPVEDYPPGPLGDVVRLGEQLVNETSSHPLTKSFVGNQLNCRSCHLDAGRHPKAASFIGVAAAYPAYSSRESAVITLEDRILNCFLRSQNGSRPPNGGQVSVAIASYITWLSRSTPLDMNPSAPLGPNRLPELTVSAAEPSITQGKALYAERCANCH